MKNALLVVFLLALIIRLAPGIISGFPAGVDSYAHAVIANEFIETNSIPMRNSDEYRLYPMIYHEVVASLSIVSDTSVLLWQIFLPSFITALTCVLIYLLLKQNTRKEIVSLAGALFFAFSPGNILFSASAGMPQVFGIFLFLLIFYIFLSKIGFTEKAILIFILSLTLAATHVSSSMLFLIVIQGIFFILLIFIFLGYPKVRASYKLILLIISYIGIIFSHLIFNNVYKYYIGTSYYAAYFTLSDIAIKVLITSSPFIALLFLYIYLANKNMWIEKINKTASNRYIIYITAISIIAIFTSLTFIFFEPKPTEYYLTTPLWYFPIFAGITATILSYFGIYYALKKHDLFSTFLIVLLFLSFLIAFAGKGNIREMTFIGLPISMLGALGTEYILFIINKFIRRTLIIIGIILMVIPAILATSYMTVNWLNSEERDDLIYLNKISYINESVACISSCQYIDYFLNGTSRDIINTEVFATTNMSKKVDIIRNYNITYLFLDKRDKMIFIRSKMTPVERGLNIVFGYMPERLENITCVEGLCNLNEVKFLYQIYDKDGIEIYKVRKSYPFLAT